jgi:hypothetical protein
VIRPCSNFTNLRNFKEIWGIFELFLKNSKIWLWALNLLYKPGKIDEIWTLLNTELSISKIYKVGIIFWFHGLYFNVKFKTKLYVKRF